MATCLCVEPILQIMHPFCILTTTASQGMPALATYSASKGAELALTRSLSAGLVKKGERVANGQCRQPSSALAALECHIICAAGAPSFAAPGIRVNAVAPGPVHTPLVTSTFSSSMIAQVKSQTKSEPVCALAKRFVFGNQPFLCKSSICSCQGPSVVARPPTASAANTAWRCHLRYRNALPDRPCFGLRPRSGPDGGALRDRAGLRPAGQRGKGAGGLPWRAGPQARNEACPAIPPAAVVAVLIMQQRFTPRAPVLTVTRVHACTHTGRLLHLRPHAAPQRCVT